MELTYSGMEGSPGETCHEALSWPALPCRRPKRSGRRSKAYIKTHAVMPESTPYEVGSRLEGLLPKQDMNPAYVALLKKYPDRVVQ